MAYGYNADSVQRLYIAPIMDCFGGEIIAFAMDDNMKKELCIKALKEAYELRKLGDEGNKPQRFRFTIHEQGV